MVGITIEIFEALNDGSTERRVYNTYICERDDSEDLISRYPLISWSDDIKSIKDPMLDGIDIISIYSQISWQYHLIEIHKEHKDLIKKPHIHFTERNSDRSYYNVRMQVDAKCVNRNIETPIIYRRKLINAM